MILEILNLNDKKIMNLFNNSLYLISYLTFNTTHLNNSLVSSHNMANNWTSLTHAAGSVFSSFLYLFVYKKDKFILDLARIYSTGYFAYDATYILNNYRGTILQNGYLYHHLASIYMVHLNPEIYKSMDILFWAELSNIPSYFVYYYHKTNKNPKLLKKLKLIQFLIYSFIRTPVLTYLLTSFIKENINKHNNTVNLNVIKNILPTVPVYFMGLYWTMKLWKGL